MSLTRTNTPLLAVVDHLNAHVPDPWTAELDDPTFATRTIAVEPVTPPRTEYFAMGGPDKSRMLVQVTICAATRQEARLAGDTVRDVLTGVDRRNKPLYPLAADGYAFDNPSTTADGHRDLTDGVHTWVETFELAWQYRPEGVTPPS